MSGTLYVVATPIGNLEDITLRALRVLREVNVIAAEDTRRTARLLSHHGISSRTISFHQHNTRSRLPQLVSRLEAGENVAVVTDAGTPGVSDPGLELVQAAIEHGINVDPIPGASAPLTAVIASGFAMVPFAGCGHAPADIVEHGRGLQQQPVLVSQSVEIFQLIKELQREVGDMQDMMRLLFERLHEGEEFLASSLIIHGASKRAPKRSPRRSGTARPSAPPPATTRRRWA